MSADTFTAQDCSVRDRFGPSPLESVLKRIHDDLKDECSGEPSQSIKALATAKPDHFGMVIATADGHVYGAGDTEQLFSIQSISKAFTYGLALEDNGFERVDSKIDVEPSGDAFNEISLDPVTQRPANPMINAGAITGTWLVQAKDGASRRDRIRQLFSACAGRDLEISQEILDQESEDGHRNRALGWLLRSVDIIEEDPMEALEDYFAQCSVMVNTKDLAMMGATLAAGGLNPRTGERILHAETVERVLSVMNSCGMYDDAGAWFVRVGLPAKSGVGGGIIAVVPGQLAIATFSPPLDEHGNSVRGMATCERLSQAMDLHFARGPRPTRSTVRSINSLSQSPSLMRRDQEARDYLAHACRHVAVLEIQGDLLFPGAEETVRTMRRIGQSADAMIVDFTSVDQVADFVPHMAAAAAHGLREAGCDVVVVSGENWSQGLGETPVFKTREGALAHMEDKVLAERDSHAEQTAGLDVLGRSDALRRLGRDAAEQIWHFVEIVEVARDDYLPARFTRGGTVQWVLKGTAEVLATSGDGPPRPVRSLRPGTVAFDPREIDDDAATDPRAGQTKSLEVRAADPLTLGVLTPEALKELEEQAPQAATALWKSLAWVEAEDIVASLQEAVGWEPGDHWSEEG